MGAELVRLDVQGWCNAPGTGQAEIVHYSTAQRIGRALEAVGLVWLVGVPLSLVPLLEILVLPTAIGLSVYFAATRLRATEMARTCRGTCPDCGAGQTFELLRRFELPMEVQCHACSRELWLTEHR